ncbi:MAG: Ankyrin repeat (3 copies), partial [Rickettsiaceae bacterium]|nr:Ankyrin repeat (3 copies) [Rickettsiaceae bacterium]
MKRTYFEASDELSNYNAGEEAKRVRLEELEKDYEDLIDNGEESSEDEDEEVNTHIKVHSEDQVVLDLTKAIIEHDLKSFKAIIDTNLNLLDEEFPVNTKLDHMKVGYNILHMLIDEEFLEGLKHLIKNHGEHININILVNEQRVLATEDEDFDDDSVINSHNALMIASLVGNPQIVSELIDADANVNYCNDFNETPLLVAIEKGNIDVITKLIKAGANVRQGDNFDDYTNDIIPSNTPLGIICGFQDEDHENLISEEDASLVIQELLFTYNISFTQEELVFLETSPFKKVQYYIRFYHLFTQVIQENIADDLKVEALFRLFVINPNFLIKLVDSYLKVKNIDLAVSIDDSKMVNTLKLLSCVGKILDGDKDKKMVLIDVIKDNFDLKLIEKLVGNYYCVNKFKLNAKDIEDYISKLLINIGPNMNPLIVHKIKDYNNILFYVKNRLTDKAIKISHSLETLEKCLVDMLDSDFNEILTYNKKDLENKELIKKGLPPKWDLQSKPTTHEGIESVLGLKGRVETNESDNGFEGEIYGSGKILELFLSKLDTVNFEIDASSVTFDIKEFFNGL